MSPQIVITYPDFLTSAFLFLKSQRQNIEGKQLFAIGEKYYMEDLGLRTALRGFRQSVWVKLLKTQFTSNFGNPTFR